MSDEWRKRLLSVAFTLAVVVLIGLVLAPLPLWTPSPAPTPEATATPEPTATPRADLSVCAQGCDFTTLQEAVDSAGSGDVIAVLDAVHTEQGITVDRELTILGQSPDGTIVQGHTEPGEATESVFVIAEGASATLKDLTIRHGNPEAGIESGGGVHNRGMVTLERCVITENNASAGGGLNNFGSMTLIDSTVSNNVADGSGEFYTRCGTGGGIKGEQGPLVLINSTVSGNSSRGNGGGIFVACKCVLELTNSTVSGNDATGGSGGGIYIKGWAQLENSTIAHNNAAATGGGVYMEGSHERGVIRGRLDFTNTIIADNTDGREYCCDDCMLGNESSIVVNANNLVEDGSCDPAWEGDPMLAPLGVNGGDTRTHPLLPGSPAIDAISTISCTLPTDQRGMARPVELTSNETPCDVGAFEVQAQQE
jgi:predicted outer membrane repeat protein